tara:strand:+ start:361 stop:579 length:219 start_codon:yes stop_codon:yes gene_type:complete
MTKENKINFIKNYIKDTHCQQDFEDLLTFSTEEINQIYNEIIEEEITYSCCGDEMTIDLIDYGICPTCKEHI